jgi:KDO2-lipid IV(A) lauroyltransferase
MFGCLPMRDQIRARQHLAQAFPDRDAAWVRRTSHRCFGHFGGMILWTLAAQRRGMAWMRQQVEFEMPAMRSWLLAPRPGAGLLGLSAHFGNWELLAQSMGAEIRLAVVGKRMRHPLADAWLRHLRERHGSTMIYQDDGAIAVLRALRNNDIVATLIDQDIGRLAGCFVPFFGRLAHTPIAPAQLACRAGDQAAVVLCFRRKGKWCIRVVSLPKLEPEALTAAATAVIETAVREYPQQWVWWHRRWRTRPAGEFKPR